MSELHPRIENAFDESLYCENFDKESTLSELTATYPFFRYAVENVFVRAFRTENEGVLEINLVDLATTYTGIINLWTWNFNLIQRCQWEKAIGPGATMLHMWRFSSNMAQILRQRIGGD